MSLFIAAIEFEFRRHHSLADKGLAQLGEDLFFARPMPHVNSPAIIVKHLSASMRSRWTDFLGSDGDKTDRRRDSEFEVGTEARAELLADWEQGWQALYATLKELSYEDLDRVVLIRDEPHTVLQALLRGLSHVTYHVGQLLYLVRLLNPNAAWLTIAPGKSHEIRPGYLSAGSHNSGEPKSNPEKPS
jgi:hypothetical protein